MFGFGPNVNALAAKRDHEGLGKLLRHKDKSIREASARALLRLLKDFPDREKRRLIERQFGTSPNDKDVIAVLMGEVESLPAYVGNAYMDSVVMATLHAGGCNELVAFNKKMVLSDSDGEARGRANMLNQSISCALIGYAVFRRFGVKELVDILPYAAAQASEDAFALQEALERSETLTLPGEDIRSITERISRLPPSVTGLGNFVKSKLAPLLLTKLKEREQL